MKAYTQCIILLGCINLTACKAIVKDSDPIQPVEQYIDYTEKLNNASDRELAREHSHALSAYSISEEIDKRIYLALILSRTDHPKTDLEEARSHFLAILNDKKPPAASVKKFIENELHHVIAIIEAKNRYEKELSNSNRLKDKISELDAENKELTKNRNKLQKELDEAEEKLRALTDLEQDLSQSQQSGHKQ